MQVVVTALLILSCTRIHMKVLAMYCWSIYMCPLADLGVVAMACMLTQAGCYLSYNSFPGNRGTVMFVTMV